MKTLAKAFAVTLAAAGIAASAATPAFANAISQDPEGRMVALVNTTDLDLATAEGQRELDQRVNRAVRAVCRTTNIATGTRIISREAQDCLANARKSARQQVAALKAAEQRGG